MSLAPSSRLDRKAAMVTGGGGGIGRSIVGAFVALGARIGTIEVDPVRARDLRDALGDDHIVVEGDVRSTERIAVAFTAVETRFGGLDILANNIGDNLRLRWPFETRSEQDWARSTQSPQARFRLHARGAATDPREAHGRQNDHSLQIEAYRDAPPAASTLH